MNLQSEIFTENLIYLPRAVTFISLSPNFELHNEALEFYYGYVLTPELSGVKTSTAGVGRLRKQLKMVLEKLKDPRDKRDKILDLVKRSVKGLYLVRSKSCFFSHFKEFILSFLLTYPINRSFGRNHGWVRIAAIGEFKKLEFCSLIGERDQIINVENFETNTIFELLTPNKICRVLLSVILEQNLVFVASDSKVLTNVICTFMKLIYPMQWECTLIPNLPPQMLHLLESTVPFVIGITEPLFNRINLNKLKNCNIVRLDTAKLTFNNPILKSPNFIHEDLVENIKFNLIERKKKSKLSSVKKYSYLEWVKFKKVNYLRMKVIVLNGLYTLFKNCIFCFRYWIDFVERKDIIKVFDFKKFIEMSTAEYGCEEFFTAFFETMIFSQFVMKMYEGVFCVVAESREEDKEEVDLAKMSHQELMDLQYRAMVKEFVRNLLACHKIEAKDLDFEELSDKDYIFKPTKYTFSVVKAFKKNKESVSRILKFDKKFNKINLLLEYVLFRALLPDAAEEGGSKKSIGGKSSRFSLRSRSFNVFDHTVEIGSHPDLFYLVDFKNFKTFQSDETEKRINDMVYHITMDFNFKTPLKRYDSVNLPMRQMRVSQPALDQGNRFTQLTPIDSDSKDTGVDDHEDIRNEIDSLFQ